MSFNVALSGLNAAQKDLNVTSNNIANVNTIGFKQSRAEFADVYASSIFSAGKSKSGDGVATSQVAQMFDQGTRLDTNNSLDLSITGDGFFTTTSSLGSRDMTFTRAGAFGLNDNNFIVDSQGNFLQGFQVDAATGDAASVTLSTTQPIQVPDSAGAPRATANAFMTMNLDSRLSPPAVAVFDAADKATWNKSTSIDLTDSLGETHLLGVFYVKAPAPAANAWDVHYTLDGQDLSGVPGSGVGVPADTLQFDASGNPMEGGVAGANFPAISLTGGPGTGISSVLTNGAEFPAVLQVHYRDSSGTKIPTQFAANFEVKSSEQDGAAVGQLIGMDIDSSGKLVASYSNGDSTFLGQIAIARFANVQGLTQVGNTSWKTSQSSGEPLAGEANSGTFGSIQSSSLEASNVNLTNELVDLIAAQRNFQANSRSLDIDNQLSQNILQIR